MIHTKMMRTSCFSKNIQKIHLPRHLNQPHPILKTRQTSRKTKIPRRTENEANTRCLSRRSSTYQDVGPGEGGLGRFFIPRDRGTQKDLQQCRDPGCHHGVASGVQNLRPEVFGRNHSSEIRILRILIRPLSKKTQLFFLSTC